MKPGTIIRRYVLAAALLFIGAVAMAHIKNEATQFPDIEYSDSRFDIVVLVGAGIIPETPVFEPDKPLAMGELASWAALAEGLGRGGENPDVEALAVAALEQGLVATLDGDATLGDIDRVFFGGTLQPGDGDRVPTKAEAATLIATELAGPSGAALLEKRGLQPGASGEVTAVGTEQGHHGDAYVLTIGGVSLTMDEHGRVANGPTDLLQWQGRSVKRSFVRGEGDHAQWLYLEAEPREVSAEAVAMPAEEAVAEAPPPERSLLYWLLAALAVLAVVLFVSRRKSG